MKNSNRILAIYNELFNIAKHDYRDIISNCEILFSQNNLPWKLRLFLFDESFIDIILSLEGRYSYHWDRREIDNKIYRHDNAPHERWININTFPKHFHFEKEDNVIESNISDNPIQAIIEFLNFVRTIFYKKVLEK